MCSHRICPNPWTEPSHPDIPVLRTERPIRPTLPVIIGVRHMNVPVPKTGSLPVMLARNQTYHITSTSTTSILGPIHPPVADRTITLGPSHPIVPDIETPYFLNRLEWGIELVMLVSKHSTSSIVRLLCLTLTILCKFYGYFVNLNERDFYFTKVGKGWALLGKSLERPLTQCKALVGFDALTMTSLPLHHLLKFTNTLLLEIPKLAVALFILPE